MHFNASIIANADKNAKCNSKKNEQVKNIINFGLKRH